jgi:hypothetical protein
VQKGPLPNTGWFSLELDLRFQVTELLACAFNMFAYVAFVLLTLWGSVAAVPDPPPRTTFMFAADAIANWLPTVPPGGTFRFAMPVEILEFKGMLTCPRPGR